MSLTFTKPNAAGGNFWDGKSYDGALTVFLNISEPYLDTSGDFGPRPAITADVYNLTNGRSEKAVIIKGAILKNVLNFTGEKGQAAAADVRNFERLGEQVAGRIKVMTFSNGKSGPVLNDTEDGDDAKISAWAKSQGL